MPGQSHRRVLVIRRLIAPRRADLAVGTFYQHFPSKRDLYSAIIEAKAGEVTRHAGALRELARGSDEKFHTRLKRVYEVELTTDVGGSETRYVLAKSVGWGWLGYHALFRLSYRSQS